MPHIRAQARMSRARARMSITSPAARRLEFRHGAAVAVVSPCVARTCASVAPRRVDRPAWLDACRPARNRCRAARARAHQGTRVQRRSRCTDRIAGGHLHSARLRTGPADRQAARRLACTSGDRRAGAAKAPSKSAEVCGRGCACIGRAPAGGDEARQLPPRQWCRQSESTRSIAGQGAIGRAACSGATAAPGLRQREMNPAANFLEART